MSTFKTVVTAPMAVLASTATLAVTSIAMPVPASAATQTAPALTVSYSADRRIETDGAELLGRVHAAPGMERTETRIGDMSTVLILRMDRRQGWTLMPMQKMYQEVDIGKAGKQAGSVTPEQTELELVGEETISGQLASRYKFVTKDRSAGGFLWYTDTGIPVKMDLLSKSGGKSTRMTVTLENIRVETQDPALFEVPAGFNRMPVAGGFLGGLGDAVSRPVKSEATAIGNDIANADTLVTRSVEQAVAEEVRGTGAKATVREKLRSVGGLLRNR